MTAPLPKDPLADLARDLKARKVITERFEFTGERKDKVPTTEVYAAVAPALGDVHPHVVTRTVLRIVHELGGRYTTPRNRRFFRHMRRKGEELVPMQGKTSAQLMGAWMRRLREEGMADEPKELPKFKDHRAEINIARLDIMRRDYWRRRRELDIWGMYGEGLSELAIADKVGMSRSAIHRIVAREKARLDRLAQDERGADDGEEECETHAGWDP